MDNLTHSLTGLLLSRAGLGKAVPHATPLLILAANIPDIDIVSMLWGPDFYLRYHRGFTHALAAIPAMALLPVLIVWLWWGKREPLPWLNTWLVSLAGVASHPLIDYTNAYGIRLLLPFSDEFIALSITGVVDGVIWFILLFAALFPALSRLVSSEIGGKRTTGQGLAIFALVFFLAYDAARYVLHQRVIAVQEARLYEGSLPKRILAYPHFVNPLLWDGVVETEQAWILQPVRLWEDFDPGEGQLIYKTGSSPALETARRTQVFRTFLDWSRAPHFQVLPAAGAENVSDVRAVDLWFRFAAKATIGPNGDVRSTALDFR